ncbi:MAG: AAA family ATPase [Lachnospiraceae bacterium]|nr:AAA family ATPase [Lachnospiraceae bacterium]
MAIPQNNFRFSMESFRGSGAERMVLDHSSFARLDSGIYALRKVGSDLVVCSAKEKELPVCEFMKNRDKGNYMLEKKEGKALLLLPPEDRAYKYDFFDSQEEYRVIIDCLKSCTECTDIALCCDHDGRVVGMSDLSGRKLKLFSFEASKDIGEIISFRELEEQYIKGDLGRYMHGILEKLPPKEVLRYCQKRIQGQGTQLKAAVYQVYRYMQDVADGDDFQAQNWVLTAPSGSGKTEFYRAVRDLFAYYKIPIPVVQIDLSQITETGYKGSNVSTIPERILAERPNAKGIGICFLDEADKKCVPSYESHGMNVNAAVQANLLTLLEGSRLKVEADDEKRDFDSGHTMFVLMGAFQGIREQKQKAEKKPRQLGFVTCCEDTDSADKADATDRVSDCFYEDLSLQDLVDFGMQEELAGRIVQIVNFHKLSREDMLVLIRDKVKEISEEIRIDIDITESAAEEFVDVSFGSLGVRRPMNMIRALVQNKVAEVFFEGKFDSDKDTVVIDSLKTARIERGRGENDKETDRKKRMPGEEKSA